MDSLPTAELIEIALLLRGDAQTQFEYWFSITFAVIGAAFFGRRYLTNQIRATVSTLYLLTTLLLVLRYLEAALAASTYITAVVDRGLEFIPEASITFFIRLAIFVIGAASTIWFLYSKDKERDGET